MCQKRFSKDHKEIVACTLVGCKDCKHFDGTEYYKKNIKAALGKWVKQNKQKFLGYL